MLWWKIENEHAISNKNSRSRFDIYPKNCTIWDQSLSQIVPGWTTTYTFFGLCVRLSRWDRPKTNQALARTYIKYQYFFIKFSDICYRLEFDMALFMFTFILNLINWGFASLNHVSFNWYNLGSLTICQLLFIEQE